MWQKRAHPKQRDEERRKKIALSGNSWHKSLNKCGREREFHDTISK